MASSIRSSRSSHWSGWAIATACLVASAPLVASAREPAQRGRDVDLEVARAKAKQAQTAYDLGRFEEALEAYAAAYESKPMPAFLFNIAQCHKELGRYERAIFFYRRYLDRTTSSRDAETVQRLIESCEAKQALARQQQPPPSPPSSPSLAPTERGEVAEGPPPKVSDAPRVVPPPSPTLTEATARDLAQSPGSPATSAPPSVASGPTPLHRRWWFWTAIGAAVVGGTATAIALSQPHLASTTLGTINAR